MAMLSSQRSSQGGSTLSASLEQPSASTAATASETRARISEAPFDADARDRNRPDHLGFAAVERAGGGHGFFGEGRVHPFCHGRDEGPLAEHPALFDAQIQPKKGR